MFVKSGRISDRTKNVLRYLSCFLLMAALLSGCGGIPPKGEGATGALQEESPGTAEDEAFSGEENRGALKDEAGDAAVQEKRDEAEGAQSPAEDRMDETLTAQDGTDKPGTSAAQATGEENAGDGGGRIIYEGRYFDERWYDYVDMPAEESPLVYCEVLINNVTDASFDFVINEEVMATGETVPVVSAGTAAIEGDGKSAVYRGDNMTLTFTFSDDRDTFPQHLQIAGLEKLENHVYMNNSIPGHESG